jgi:fumarylacetoacetase
LSAFAFGVFERPGERPRVGARAGESVLDLAAALGDEVFAEPALNAFMAQGRARWTAVRAQVAELLAGLGRRPTRRSGVRGAGGGRGAERWLLPLAGVRLRLPFQVADYVDFYASEHHARNLGRILRPGAEELAPNWRHLPVGYHGRAGTVVVSGTPVVRPCGQYLVDREGPVFGPTRRLDVEAEVGMVVGVPSEPGRPVAVDEVREHVFGVVLVNDWSARDIQAWESRPLGPFLGKSFATSVSAWVVPLDDLAEAMVTPPAQDPEPLPYLRGRADWALDLTLQVRLNGHVVSRPPFAGMYWTPAQQLAHMTSNGAGLRTGDLYASGTVSGPARDQRGSLIELSWDGSEPIELPDGSTRTFLEDGDTVEIRATAPGPGGTRLDLGQVTGTVGPAR